MIWSDWVHTLATELLHAAIFLNKIPKMSDDHVKVGSDLARLVSI